MTDFGSASGKSAGVRRSSMSRAVLNGHRLVGWRCLTDGRFMPAADPISTDDRRWVPVFVRARPNWCWLKEAE